MPANPFDDISDAQRSKMRALFDFDDTSYRSTLYRIIYSLNATNSINMHSKKHSLLKTSSCMSIDSIKCHLLLFLLYCLLSTSHLLLAHATSLIRQEVSALLLTAIGDAK